MTRRYAEDTKVSTSQSQAEIKDMLKALGADRIGVFESSSTNYIIFEVPPTREAGPTSIFKLSQPVPDGDDLTEKKRDQLERSLWRALVLLVKAKKVAIEGGITTLEREFMADTVLSDGSTLIEHRRQLLEHNYKEGGQPLLGFEG